MSTEFGTISCEVFNTEIEVYTSLNSLRLLIRDDDELEYKGIKVVLTEETYKEFMTAMETAAAHLGWKKEGE